MTSRSINPEAGAWAPSIHASLLLPAVAVLLLIVLTACARRPPQRTLPVLEPVDPPPTNAESTAKPEPAPAPDWSNLRPDLRPDELWPHRFVDTYERMVWGTGFYKLRLMENGVYEWSLAGWYIPYTRYAPGQWYWDGSRLHLLRDGAGKEELLEPVDVGLRMQDGQVWGGGSRGAAGAGR